MRIGAENSTCALFGKRFFLSRLLQKCLFFRVSRARDLNRRAIAAAAPPKANVDACAANAAILVAKSWLSACSVSANRPPPGAAVARPAALFGA
jgi:hypothetical protein